MNLWHKLKQQTELIDFGYPSHLQLHGGKRKMANLREESLQYEAKTTKNISELKKVSTMIEVHKKDSETKDGTPFSYEFVEVDGEEYRLPASVKKQLKEHIEENPEMEFFKVKKSGSGMDTNYTVIPQ